YAQHHLYHWFNVNNVTPPSPICACFVIIPCPKIRLFLELIGHQKNRWTPSFFDSSFCRRIASLRTEVNESLMNTTDSSRSTGSLRGFWSLFVTQFQGAFSDNALKWLVIFVALFGAVMTDDQK